MFLSSPFLFVYGDDRVIRYTRVDVETGGADDVQPTEWGLALGIRARVFLSCIYYVLLWTWILETCNTLMLCYGFWRALFNKIKFSRVGIIIQTTFGLIYFFYLFILSNIP